MTATAAGLRRKIEYLTGLAARAATPGEKAAADRALARLRATLAKTAETERRTWEPWFKGAKCDATSGVPANGQLTRLIREDLKLALKAGRATGNGTGLAVAGDPFASLPPTVGLRVRMRHHGSFTVTVTGIPRDWGYQHDRSRGHDVPTRALAALSAEVYAIANAYNYDDSDLMSDYYCTRYYLRVEGEEGCSLPRDFQEWRYA